MSHELRTPLNAIIGYSEIIEEDLGVAGNVQSATDAGRVKRAARHLLTLITEILDFSKIDAGRMEVTLGEADVGAIIAEVIEIMAPLAESNGNRVAVSTALAAPVVTDAGKVRQCLVNLVSNACKFTTNGAIAIDARTNAQGLLQIAVTDTGCGIAPGEASRLFQPFVQADSSFTRTQGGTGLGLVISRRLMQLLGGDVVMESVPGVGSTFTMTFVAQPEALGAKAAPAPELVLDRGEAA
jgi:signal transduction histidine kinase